MAILDGLELPHGWKVSSRQLATWPIDGDHNLELWPAARTDGGRLRWHYRLSRKRSIIFAAADISSGRGAELTQDELVRAARTVLSYLTLRPGDTDAEYFAPYTRGQIAWRDEFAEDLSIYALDGSCGYCGGDHLSPGCLSWGTRS